MHYQLKTRQIALFFIAFMPTIKFFMLPSVLAITTNEDMWISALLMSVLDGITLLFILGACKKHKCNFRDLLISTFGKPTANFIFLLFAVYFLLKAFLPVIEQKEYIETTLYSSMPNALYFFPFYFILFYVCTKGLRIWGRLSDITWAITLLGFIILIALSTSNVDFSEILPMFASGPKNIIKGGLYSSVWFNDAIYLLFFMGEFKWEKKSYLKICIGYLIGILMVIIFMIFFYCVFTSISFRQQFALTEITKYTTVINNTGRFDYLGIIMLVFSDILSICLPGYFSVKCINTVFNVKKRWITPLIVVLIVFFVSIFLTEFTDSIENLLILYASYFFILIGNVLPILISLKKPKEREYEQVKN